MDSVSQHDVDAYLSAIDSANLSSLRTLLRTSASITNNRASAIALRAAIERDLLAVIEVYLDEGFDFRSDCDGEIPLITAAKGGHCPVITRLLDANACDIEAADIDGMTPLLHAAFAQQEEAVRLLVKAGANVQRINCEGRNALDLARLKRFSIPAWPLVGPGYGIRRTIRDSPVAKYLREQLGC